MTDAEEEVEPTDPDIAAFYQRQAKRQRIVGLSFVALSVVVLVVAIIGSARGHVDAFSRYFILSAALLGPGITLFLLARAITRR